MTKEGVLLLALAVLFAACNRRTGVDDLAQAKAGPPVKLGSIEHTVPIPQSVVPYGRPPAFVLSDLQLVETGGDLKGKVKFVRKGQGDFVLVLYLSTNAEQLVTYFDPETRLTFWLPKGVPMMTTSKQYVVSGLEHGSITFEQDLEAPTIYDLVGEKGEAFVFCVPGKVWINSTLPGDQQDSKTLQANSNVLRQAFAFE